MALHSIKMPDIGEGIAEVELVAWHVKVGDAVHEDQILADVMTDKATVEIPSHVAGVISALHASVGQVVAVGTEIIHIEVSSESPSVSATSVAAPPPLATKPATEVVVNVASAPTPAASAAAPQVNSDRPIASPALRRRAWELGINLHSVSPTGTAGRITQADLDQYLQKNPIPTGSAQTQPPESHPVPTDEVIPVIGLRRKIALKMQESKRRIPHFTYVEEIDVTELEKLRATLNELHTTQRGKLTLLPFLIRAMVQALRQYPQINARYDDEAGVVTRYGAVHLGLATQTSGGLIVPVIRHVEALDLWQCAAAIRQTSEAARSGKSSREDLSGSSISLTSLGALGGIVSTPVINHPEVAIVGTNRIVERPAFQEGHLVARKTMNLSSSFDHRVVDGMDAAQFIQHIRHSLEQPALLLL
jgi:2-oxoisovalerate dehydrogenase E2 component (dihydrolipoyl transacylase)